MTMSDLSENIRGALLPALIGAAAMVLAACSGGGVTGGGGGGPTVTASSYLLFASNYVRYVPGPQNGAYLHSLQGGDVFAVTDTQGGFGYGCFDFDQPTINGTQLYLFQAQANPQPGCGAPPPNTPPPATAGDFFLLAIKSPGSCCGLPAVPFDISQANTLLIQMGNSREPQPGPNPEPAGHANTFTLALNNDTLVFQDGTTECKYIQTLDGTGQGTSNYPPPEFSTLGARDYAIPMAPADWQCTNGKDINELKVTGITNIAIIVTGGVNPDLVAGEFDNIVVGKIGFTK